MDGCRRPSGASSGASTRTTCPARRDNKKQRGACRGRSRRRWRRRSRCRRAAGSGDTRDLRAFQIAGPLYHAVARELGAEHAATAALHTVLEELSCGCHRFDHAGKATAYLAARDAASRAACELALLDRADAAAWLECIEQELMAALAGLLRRLDRLNRRRRAHGLPAASAGEASAGAASASAASETADEASTTGASAGRGSAARASR